MSVKNLPYKTLDTTLPALNYCRRQRGDRTI